MEGVEGIMIDTRLLISYCDALASKLTCAEFGGRCIVCGRPGTDCHHWAFGRSIRKYRWRLENLVWMCRGDHDFVREDDGLEVEIAIIRYSPHRHAWKDNLPPLKVEPFGNFKIQQQYEFLKSVARRTILKEGDKDV